MQWGNGAKNKFYGVNNENSFFAPRGNYDFFYCPTQMNDFFFLN